jgi:hypothetical protein
VDSGNKQRCLSLKHPIVEVLDEGSKFKQLKGS